MKGIWIEIYHWLAISKNQKFFHHTSPGRIWSTGEESRPIKARALPQAATAGWFLIYLFTINLFNQTNKNRDIWLTSIKNRPIKRASVQLGWFGSSWESCTFDGRTFKSSRAKCQTSKKTSWHWNWKTCQRGKCTKVQGWNSTILKLYYLRLWLTLF